MKQKKNLMLKKLLKPISQKGYNNTFNRCIDVKYISIKN